MPASAYEAMLRTLAAGGRATASRSSRLRLLSPEPVRYLSPVRHSCSKTPIHREPRIRTRYRPRLSVQFQTSSSAHLSRDLFHRRPEIGSRLRNNYGAARLFGEAVDHLRKDLRVRHRDDEHANV